MTQLEEWVDENLDDLYSLNNEEHYLSAIEVRGHQYILK